MHSNIMASCICYSLRCKRLSQVESNVSVELPSSLFCLQEEKGFSKNMYVFLIAKNEKKMEEELCCFIEKRYEKRTPAHKLIPFYKGEGQT